MCYVSVGSQASQSGKEDVFLIFSELLFLNESYTARALHCSFGVASNQHGTVLMDTGRTVIFAPSGVR